MDGREDGGRCQGRRRTNFAISICFSSSSLASSAVDFCQCLSRVSRSRERGREVREGREGGGDGWMEEGKGREARSVAGWQANRPADRADHSSHLPMGQHLLLSIVNPALKELWQGTGQGGR